MLVSETVWVWTDEMKWTRHVGVKVGFKMAGKNASWGGHIAFQSRAILLKYTLQDKLAYADEKLVPCVLLKVIKSKSLKSPLGAFRFATVGTHVKSPTLPIYQICSH